MIEQCFACGGVYTNGYFATIDQSSKFCKCSDPMLTNPPTHVDKSVDTVEIDYLSAMPVKIIVNRTDAERRESIAIQAMVAIESANFANSHQSVMTVEQVAERAIELADELIARLKL